MGTRIRFLRMGPIQIGPPRLSRPFREGNIIGLARGWGPGEPQGRYGAMQRRVKRWDPCSEGLEALPHP